MFPVIQSQYRQYWSQYLTRPNQLRSCISEMKNLCQILFQNIFHNFSVWSKFLSYLMFSVTNGILLCIVTRLLYHKSIIITLMEYHLESWQEVQLLGPGPTHCSHRG